MQSSANLAHCLHWPDNTYHRITLRLVSTFNKTEFDQKENMLLLFVSSSVSSWIQTCKTGDQTHSDSFPNGECSLHWHWYLLLWFVCTSINYVVMEMEMFILSTNLAQFALCKNQPVFATRTSYFVIAKHKCQRRHSQNNFSHVIWVLHNFRIQKQFRQIVQWFEVLC